jgi:hypothetical protein
MKSHFFIKNVYSANELMSKEVSVELVGDLLSEQNRSTLNNADYKQAIVMLLVHLFLKKATEIGLLSKTEAEDISYIIEDYLERGYCEVIDDSQILNFEEFNDCGYNSQDYAL